MKIGELARLSGLPASTLRYWERAGLLPAPARSGGQRRYSQEAVHLVAVLRLAQSCGFTLAEMRQLLHGFAPDSKPSRRWQVMAEKKTAELDSQIEKLRAMRKLVSKADACDCESLVQCGRIATKVMGEAPR